MLRAQDPSAPGEAEDSAPAHSADAAAHKAGAPRFARFMGLDIEIGPDVLAPRGETELLGRVASAVVAALPAPARIIDMCCGSGNLALALASRHPDARIFASDLTDGTVAMASRNAERLGLLRQVTVVQGDLFEALDPELEGQVDLVVCNPPYISSKRLAGDRSYLLAQEPREAFDGGPYGVSIQQRLVRDAQRFLKPGGWLAFEFGHGQERLATGLLSRAGGYTAIDLRHDEAGDPRVAVARRSG